MPLMLTHRRISAGLVRLKSGMRGQPSQHSAVSVYHLRCTQVRWAVMGLGGDELRIALGATNAVGNVASTPSTDVTARRCIWR